MYCVFDLLTVSSWFLHLFTILFLLFQLLFPYFFYLIPYFQIAKLIEDSPSNTKNAIEEKVLLDWLVEKKVLSIALEGNKRMTLCRLKTLKMSFIPKTWHMCNIWWTIHEHQTFSLCLLFFHTSYPQILMDNSKIEALIFTTFSFYLGNIDQTQYCDKLKVIVEFIGSRLSAEELTKIWKMQVGGYQLTCDKRWKICFNSIGL